MSTVKPEPKFNVGELVIYDRTRPAAAVKLVEWWNGEWPMYVYKLEGLGDREFAENSIAAPKPKKKGAAGK
jgi:hypothetical protein